MGAKICYLENDEALVSLVQPYLRGKHISAITIRADAGLEQQVHGTFPDLIVIDAPFCGIPGAEVCRQVRGRYGDKPSAILLLTDSKDDVLLSLAAGADESLLKPVSGTELSERIQKLLQRYQPRSLVSLLRSGSIVLNRETQTVWRAGRLIKVGTIEYRLLEFLMARVGSVFTRSQLVARVWGASASIHARTVDVYIRRLRAALIRGREIDPIRTVRDVGYAFDDQFSIESERAVKKRKVRVRFGTRQAARGGDGRHFPMNSVKAM